MASEWALQLAATAWCTESTGGKVMDTELAKAFAEILDEVKCKSESKVTQHVLTDDKGDVLHVCMTASFSLPSDHWIYLEPVEPLDKVDLSDELRAKILDSLRYTIQVCTSRGKDPNFDPDAMCATMILSLSGVFSRP